MSNEHPDAPLTPPHPSVDNIACARPIRDRIASALDKAHITASLFGGPVSAIKLDRFTLLERIGAGGMGELYAAYDERLDRKVAIKLVRGDQFAPESADDRLLREAQTLAQLSHPNVVQVFEAGTVDGRVYIAMEYIYGVTLRGWLASHAPLKGRKRVRAVLRMFIEAGRGLEAVHRAGLVHRDFKPENVLVSDDARPRIVDFGLARLVTTEVNASNEGENRPLLTNADTIDYCSEVPSVAGLRAAVRLTTRRRLMGTPQYMAPEQVRCEEPDNRTDQFSFCVALYEALYGEPPFPGDMASALSRADDSGDPPEPPRNMGVPASIRRALLRGLSPRQGDRFSSMDALLDALEAWPRRRRRGWLIAAFLVLLLIGGAVYANCNEALDPCGVVVERMGQLWTPARANAIGERFVGTGKSYAETTWRNVEAGLERYVSAWKHEAIAACMATRVQGEQSGELLDRRMICFARGRRRFQALLDQFERANAAVVERATYDLTALPALEACRDLESLRYGLALPDPDEAPDVERIRDALSEVRTLENRSQHDEALRAAREQIAASEKLRYRAVHAEALYEAARILVYAGTSDTVKAGEAHLERASNIAESTRHDELVAEIRNLMVLSAFRNHSNTKLGHTWSARAFAAIERLGERPLYRAEAERNQGLLNYNDGDYAASEARLRRALALLTQAGDPSRFLQARYIYDLANTLRRQRRWNDARVTYEQALALYLAELGPGHPNVADVRFDMAMLDVEEGRLDHARHALEDVLRIDRKQLGEQHPLVGGAHLELAMIHHRQGDLKRAHRHAAAGLSIYELAFPADHIKLADAHLLKAKTPWHAFFLIVRKRALSGGDFLIIRNPHHADVGPARFRARRVPACRCPRRTQSDEAFRTSP